MLSGLRKLRVSSSLRCHAVIQNYGTSLSFPSTRRFVTTSTAANSKGPNRKSLEDYGSKTTIVDYIGDRFGGNMHGLGMITYLNGDTYEGQLEHNLRHGYGKFVTNDGYIYQGEWLNDSMHGIGTIFYDTGDIFNGRFQNNIRFGHGRTVYHHDKSAYEGEYNNRPHGWGELTQTNGDKYEGEFSDGWKSGFGTFHSADGSYYEGEWRRNEKHGRGKERAPTGDVYVGMYQEGLKAGEGEMTYADGSSYVGQWAADKPHGAGTLTKATGEVLQGSFLYGVYSTKKSALHDKNATISSGRMESSHKNATAPGVSELDESATQPRRFSLAEYLLALQHANEHLSTSEGVLIDKQGRMEAGGWVNEEVLGTGVREKTFVPAQQRNESLLMYEGEGKDGARHGRGRIIHPNGLIQEGEFRGRKTIGILRNVSQ